MSHFMFDVETTGPAPGLYSMIQVGVILLTKDFKTDTFFYGEFQPISLNYLPEALKVTGVSWDNALLYPDPEKTTKAMYQFIMDHKKGRPFFISDCGQDWNFVNYYLWRYCEDNPFGHSSINLGSLYKGWKNDMFSSFKHLRKTAHTHNPVDDARGNAEALYEMIRQGFMYVI
ncbi:MAG: exonuclease [Brevinematales bacterium]|nr:exonuclease [Brevinematales bacterium]